MILAIGARLGLVFVAFVGLGLPTTPTLADAAARPSIVFILSDDEDVT